MEKNDLTEKKLVREFLPTTFALRNRNTVFLLTLLLVLFGLIVYKAMPLELFPQINLPYVFVNTIYPGSSPVDIENLITRPLEKEINTINGIKQLRSVSSQDNSNIFIEFNSEVKIEKALQDVKDAVDKTKSELPNDLKLDPMVIDLDINEFPIINVNLSGDFSIEEMRDYAEYLKDEIETIPEISKVQINGLNERQIQINMDPLKMEAYKLSFNDIEDAVSAENINIGGGELVVDKTSRSIRTEGEFKSIHEIGDIIVNQEDGKDIVYLRDVADVVDGFEDPLSYARLNRQTVVSLQVIKKARENLIVAIDKLNTVLAKARRSKSIPVNLSVTRSNDQSEYVRSMVSDLENSIVMGVIFVVCVLFLFLGLRNALFVGLAIPMSMFISFIVLDAIGATINMMVLFGLVLALGMLVDNGIVVVENIHRFMSQGYSLFEAARYATGEIAMPIITSTFTTLAAFFPLLFWKGIMGEFMKHLPITLIISLSASLFVALVITPVLASRFIKREGETHRPLWKKTNRALAVMTGLAALCYLLRWTALGTLTLIFAVLVAFYQLFLYDLSAWFQRKILPWLEGYYLKLLRFTLKGKNSLWSLATVLALLFLSITFYGLRHGDIEFFPGNEPSFINVFAELPIGSDIQASNEFMFELEDKIYHVLQPDMAFVKSVLTTVGKGVGGENETSVGNTPQKGMVTITFVDYQYRSGMKTSSLMKKLSAALLNRYPGVQIQIVKNSMGPPTGKPVNIELSSKDFPGLLQLAQEIQRYLSEKRVPGVEGLKMDIDTNNPELVVLIDRDSARRFGLSTAQIASTVRTGLFGREVSKFKEGEEEYPIVVRLAKEYRGQVANLLNQKISFRSNSGALMQVPIASVASFQYGTTFGAVNRLKMERVITLWSNIIEGYNANAVNAQLQGLMKKYPLPEGFSYKFTGEQQEQAETSTFLARVMLIALALIAMILVLQFNSFIKPLIIMVTVVLSTIGVFAGLAAFKMNFVILMTGIGIISLAGVVVNNAIVLVDYIDFLKANARKRLGLDEDDELSLPDTKECIQQAGRTRLRPVLLTAITTILGLLPMAIGLNINFATLLTEFNPHIYFGGDNTIFWGPMSWTVIFGLSFTTILTLVLIPNMYYLSHRLKLVFKTRFKKT
ncbi:MAG: efflux RND transporter permease subunit [Candidatus Aminicenantes bacterium]|nr:efflux RND transporter permease subunit [Acidobacteriota bacterium]MCG2811540.1 efflux RND transporter permease subunit [Candidatus Aminicenantes bacterium]